LIAHGHRWPDIPGYTLAQVRLFLKAIDEEEGEADRKFAILVRAAVWADGPGFGRLIA
jgi:hypothetical protein